MDDDIEQIKQLLQINSEGIGKLSLQLINPDGTFKHRYFKTPWCFQYPPYSQVPFYLESYDSRSKKFTITVLSDKRPLPYISIDYPVIPITEAEAQQIVDHRQGSVRKIQTMELSNQPTTPATEGTTPAAAAEQPKKKGGRQAGDGRPTIRQLAITGFAENKTQDEIVAAVKAVYGDKEEKKIRSLVSLYRWSYKKKNAKPADAGAATPSAAPSPAPEAAPATA